MLTNGVLDTLEVSSELSHGLLEWLLLGVVVGLKSRVYEPCRMELARPLVLLLSEVEHESLVLVQFVAELNPVFSKLVDAGLNVFLEHQQGLLVSFHVVQQGLSVLACVQFEGFRVLMTALHVVHVPAPIITVIVVHRIVIV